MRKGSTIRSKRVIGVLCVSFALVLSVIGGGVGIAAVSAQSGTDVTEIDSCTTITEPGRYVLTDDIEGDTERRCIDISAEDVTLDGAGHTIEGTGTGIGIGAGDFAGGGAGNTTVTNVTVTDWGIGIYYEAVPGGAIRDSVVESNFRGIELGFFTDDVEVTDNTIVDNQVGLGTLFSTDNVFENNTVSDSEVADYGSEGDRDEEGPSSATVRDLRLDTATLSFEEDIQFGALRLDATGSAPSDPDDRRNVGQYVDVRSGSSGNGTLTFGVHYTDDDVEEAGVSEDSLRLYQFADGEWTALPESAVDTDANVVTTSVDNLSVLGTESVVAPLGEPADEDDGPGDDEGDETENGDEAGQDDGQKAPKTDDDETGADNEDTEEGEGGGDGDTGAEDGTDGSDAVFTDPITIEFAGITITLGPPTDPDGDGVYDDVTGDGHVGVFDAIAHAGVVTTVNHGQFDLTSDQVDALDVDRDGSVDYQDSLALVDTN